ncbi:hypothetical protein ACJRO7_024196 [Eucalyptus globulus]|uniref:RING-type domain-containing protein n=1 Tax=Eucalyptus globulus TaxID=34317 RepID=A0ABD3KDF9_EUCGL
MSWNMDIQYVNTGYPYNTSKSFMEYFEGLTYEHVNFIFSGVLMLKYLLSIYPPVNTNHYKMGPSEYAYHEIRRPMVSSSMTNKQTPAISSGWEGNANSGSRGHFAASLPNSHHKSLAWFFDHLDEDHLMDSSSTTGTDASGLVSDRKSLWAFRVDKIYLFGYSCGWDVLQDECKRTEERAYMSCGHTYHFECYRTKRMANCLVCGQELLSFLPTHIYAHRDKRKDWLC